MLMFRCGSLIGHGVHYRGVDNSDARSSRPSPRSEASVYRPTVSRFRVAALSATAALAASLGPTRAPAQGPDSIGSTGGLSGLVRDSTGLRLGGASVAVVGMTLRATSD